MSNFFSIINTVMLIIIILCIFGSFVYVVPILDKVKTSFIRIDSIIDRVDKIPDIDWSFLSNTSEQEEIIASLKSGIKLYNQTSAQIANLINRTSSIPNVTWNFMTNETEQTAFVSLIKYMTFMYKDVTPSLK